MATDNNEIWQIMIGNEVYEADNATLSQWITEGRVQPTDKVKKGSLNWIDANRVPALREPFSKAATIQYQQPNSAVGAPTLGASPPNIYNPAAVPSQNLYNPQAQAGAYQQPLANYIDEIRENQNLPMGIAAGVVATLIGAIIWAVITAATGYQIGYMGLLAGLLVGYSIRIFGKGIDTIFGVVGASLSLLCCLLGNVLGACIMVSNDQSLPVIDVLFNLNMGLAVLIIKEGFGVVDLIIYGLAIYEGYKFSFRSDYEKKE